MMTKVKEKKKMTMTVMKKCNLQLISSIIQLTSTSIMPTITNILKKFHHQDLETLLESPMEPMSTTMLFFNLFKNFNHSLNLNQSK